MSATRHLFFTRRWTPKDILAIGYDLADMCAADQAGVLLTAEKDVPKKHGLLFLFVLDACLKRQSATSRAASYAVVSSIIRLVGCRVDEACGYEVHGLCVHWVEHGLLPATVVFPSEKVVLGSWKTYECEHDKCHARFVSRQQRDVHMDLHFDERVACLNRTGCGPVAATAGPSTWLVDASGGLHALALQGFFHARREASETLRLRSVPRRAGSPVPCQRVTPQCTYCNVCGDALPDKRFDDAAREWVYDDCVLYVSWARHAACHAECM